MEPQPQAKFVNRISHSCREGGGEGSVCVCLCVSVCVRKYSKFASYIYYSVHNQISQMNSCNKILSSARVNI